MADRMSFPNTFKEFIHEYEFKDEEEVYTNGAELIPSFRVIQAWEHYTSKIRDIDIRQSLNNIYDCVTMIQNNLYDIEEGIDEIDEIL